MWLGIILNIGMLIVMKYTNFFLEIGTDILNVKFTPLRLFVPVGISYYALQHISYLIDISSHSVEAETNIFCFTIEQIVCLGNVGVVDYIKLQRYTRCR